METNEQLYNRLGEMYDMIGFGGPPGPKLNRLLRIIYNEEEACTALAMTPGILQEASQVAQNLGEDVAVVAKRLEAMTDKGLLYCRSGEPKQYKLLQLLPGVFELQFMKGEQRDGDVELATLFEDILHNTSFKGSVPEITPFARVIPIETQIDSSVEIHTYEQASHYIDTAKYISLTTCYCRHQKGLLGKSCGAPKDVCLQFGPFAQFIVERKFGRGITHEEAKQVVHRAVNNGLVLTSTNAQKYIDFICACCGCCCGILTSIKNSQMPSLAAKSNFTLNIDSEACTGCEACVEACHMEALSMADDTVQVDLDRCIGCGVCTIQCPADALEMVRKPLSREPPPTFRDLQAKIMTDVQKHRFGS